MCAAAAQDAASPGSYDALHSLLHAAPAPLMWRPDVVLAAALVGTSQDEFELDLPVLVSHTGAGVTITVEEVKTGATGACHYVVGMSQSAQVVQHAKHGSSLPRCPARPASWCSAMVRCRKWLPAGMYRHV